MIRFVVDGEIPAALSTRLLRAAREGSMPAEALSTAHRELLVAEFVRVGWTDREIAERTLMTGYTTGRIRERLGLQANRVEPAA